MTEAFHRKLARISEKYDRPRVQVLKDGLKLAEAHYKELASPLRQTVKSKEAADALRKSLSQVSRKYWNSISAEEKSKRMSKAAKARWRNRKTK